MTIVYPQGHLRHLYSFPYLGRYFYFYSISISISVFIPFTYLLNI